MIWRDVLPPVIALLAMIALLSWLARPGDHEPPAPDDQVDALGIVVEQLAPDGVAGLERVRRGPVDSGLRLVCLPGWYPQAIADGAEAQVWCEWTGP